METIKTIKGYDIHERIGSGGFGVVHRAYQDTIGRDVAIKIILPHFANQPDFIRRFETEAQLIARLEHPFIVPLYDYWRDPEGAYLVMRWLRGGNLRDALANNSFGLETAALFLDQITSALAMAHRNGIVHRDLKPSNILLDEDGNVYLSDFGIAKDTSKTEGTLTGNGVVLGSPDYLSPEQARSEPVTPKTDIYSLGVMLYEVLTGQHPFPNVSSVERMYKHLNEPLPLIEALPHESADGINAIIQKATAKNPVQRYADALEIATAFRREADLSKRSPESIVEQLTLREQEILQMIVDGCSNKQVADQLFITLGTVKWHIRQLYQKLHVRSRVQAVIRARELNLIVPGTSATIAESVTGESTYVALPEPENPYKGLRAFQTADARDFFGRERLVQRLIRRLGEHEKLARFLAVVGPSGSGKSSVVKAGLVPALWRGDLPGSERWFVIEMLSGPHPLDELEIALTRVAANQAGNLREHLERDSRGLVRVAGLILPDDGSELLVIVDQFEEIFTLVEEEIRRAQFLALLHTAVTDPRSRVRVIITLRADFYDRPLNYPDFGELVRSRMETVMPLSADELEEAVTRPAARVGVSFEPGLVATITEDVHYQPGALPLLQYALTELFEQRTDRILIHEAYQALGGATGALTKRAEDLYNEQTAMGREALRQMFLRLVTLGEGSEDTRRRVMRAELLAVGENEDAMDEVIDTYAAYRLLTLDHDPTTRRPTVEIAHEAILREWERLRAWLNESRHDIRQQRLLATAADEWQQANRDKSYLLAGARLDQFVGWAAETQLVLTPGERGFLDASIAEHQRQETAEQTRQVKELQLQKRAANRLRYLVVGLTAFLIITTSLAVFAFDREAKAERQAALNHSLVLANSAQEANVSGRTELGLLLALEAVKIPDAPIEAERALRTIALGAGSQTLFEGHTSPVQTVAFSPNSRLGVSGSCSQVEGKACRAGELILWDLQSKTKLRQVVGHTDVVKGVAFTADGRNLWSASQDGTILLWDVDPTSRTFGTSIRSVAPGSGSVNAIALNADGSTVLAGTGDGSVILLNTQTGEVIRRFTGHTGSVNSVAFGPDGQTILSGGNDNTVRLWKLSTGEMIQHFDGHTNTVVKVAFKVDGKAVLSCSTDFTLRLWDMATGKELHRLTISISMDDFAVKPDNRTILVDYGGGMFVVFDLDEWRITSYLTANPTGKDLSGDLDVTVIASSASGSFALTGAKNGNVILWSMGLDRQLRRFADDTVADGFISLAVRPDGLRMVTGTTKTGEALYWDIDPNSPTNGKIRAHLGGYQDLVLPVAFSPDGRSAVIGSADWYGDTGAKKLILWNLDETSAGFGKPIYTLTGFTYYPRSATFIPDGSKLLVGTQNLQGAGELVLWEIATRTLHHIETGRDVSSILVTPDGRRALTTSAYFKDLVELNIDPASPDFGKEIRRIPTRSMTYDVKWGPDGTTLFIAENDAGLTERAYTTGTVVRQFQGQSAVSLWSVALSPDKRLVVTGNDIGEVILWDYQSGSELWRSPSQESFVWNVAFSPDSQTVFSQAAPGQPVEWHVSQPSLDELLTWIPRNRYLREFTCAERKQYRVEPLCQEAK